MRGCLQPGQSHEQPRSRSSRLAKITVTQDTAIFFFGVMTQARRKHNRAHTYIHEQHSTYLHPRTAQHTPTSTNNTAHIYIHEKHSTHLHPRTTQHIPTSTNSTAHTYIHEQHSTYLHSRKTQHIPTSTNNTAHTYIHEQHSIHLHPRTAQHTPTSTNNTAHTYTHERHSTYLHPRTTHNFFREFRSGRMRLEFIWTESWKLFSQELDFLQRTQKASINFILYCTLRHTKFFPVLWFFFQEILRSFTWIVILHKLFVINFLIFFTVYANVFMSLFVSEMLFKYLI